MGASCDVCGCAGRAEARDRNDLGYATSRRSPYDSMTEQVDAPGTRQTIRCPRGSVSRGLALRFGVGGSATRNPPYDSRGHALLTHVGRVPRATNEAARADPANAADVNADGRM